MAKKKSLRVVPLGGLDEVGKNMTVFEYGNDMVVVDAGMSFPDADSPGVDLILPDYSYVTRRADKLRGVIVTHGHEDHTGSLPYLLNDLDRPVPVFGTKLTLGLVQGKLDEAKVRKAKLVEIAGGERLDLNSFQFEFIPVNHSIPDGVAVLIRTPAGNILHTGDFKFDQTPVDGRHTDYAALAAAGDEGVLLLMSDSTNAESPGYSRTEAVVGENLHSVIRRARQRVIVASFASHIHRLQEVCDAAVDNGRKIVVAGRSMVNTTTIARELGYLHVDDDDILDAFEANTLRPEEVVVLSTGSQGEPLSALARMANQDHKTVRVQEGDTVVISASPVPGNEKAVSRVINRLFKSGAEVLHKGNADVHVSGHAAAEELKMMLGLVRPQYFMPIHGETRHLKAHAAIAVAVGIPRDNVLVVENGQALECRHGRVNTAEHVDAGVVFVDGLGVGDVGHPVLRDRQALAQDGIIVVVVAIDGHSGRIVGDPELVARGVVLGPDTDGNLVEARTRVMKTLARMESERVTDQAVVRRAVRESLSQFMWDRVRRRPMILTTVMEV